MVKFGRASLSIQKALRTRERVSFTKTCRNQNLSQASRPGAIWHEKIGQKGVQWKQKEIILTSFGRETD